MQHKAKLSMAWSYKKRTVEYIIYLLFWSVLLLSPLLGAFIKYALQKDAGYLPTTDELLAFWKFLLPALILFFINNNILLPSLLYKKRGRLLVLYLLCIVVVSAIVFISFPIDVPLFGVQDAQLYNTPPLFYTPPFAGKPFLPPPLLGERDVWMFFTHPTSIRVLLVLLVLVFNICVRLFFFTLQRDERFKELEKEKLRSELEYLKYQINPHFFMNSLNNIHALIDIDKDKAQTAVRELSGLMRYVLYDKSSKFVPLEKEIRFLKDFIELMRLRYTDRLEVTTSFTDESQGVYVPSLLFMQFVENAFKHGVTYTKKSLIDISLGIDEEGENVLFLCRNTLPGTGKSAAPTTGGIGVENARKRLKLLYGSKVSLDISSDGGWYKVELKIPVEYDKVYNS